MERRESEVIGKRVFPDEFGKLHLGAGDYARDESGNWVVHPPGLPIGTLHKSAVLSHSDGTITVPGMIMHGVWEKQ